jgi:signal transduction histidine kinase/CheY-like chemotaxis protein
VSDATVYLDPAEAAQARRSRRQRFHTEDVPRLRVLGFALNTVGIIVHNWLVAGHVDWPAAVQHAIVLLGYAAVSWAVLAFLWDRVTRINLGDVFFGLDLIPMAYVVYVTGADQSLMWFVFAARAADQVAISFRHALVFSHLATSAYISLILWVAFGEGRVVDWPIEIAKFVFLYILCLYITMSAKAVADRRRKFDTARRVAEQAVRDAADRRRDLEHALGRLEAANRTKTEFLANVSHEVRTPLNSVIGNADLLLDTPLSTEQREMLGVMRDSAESLTRIVDDILDLSKMEAQRLPLESIPVRVRDVVGQTVRMFAARAHQKGLALTCVVHHDVPDAVLGDPHRLRQVLTNVVNNAVKFTTEGRVAVSVDVDETHDESVVLRFSVEDTGIGVPRARQQAIFEAFTQADGSDTRRFGGTGLGLTIATQLVALMGGRLWVESEEGHGATFRFLSKFGVVRGAAPTPPWVAHVKHVVVAHEDALMRRSAVELLSRWPSVRVTEAAGGRAAMTALEVAQSTAAVDVLIADAGLAGLDGFELAARIQATPGLGGRVIVLLPTTQLATGAERATALGARYLMVPIVWPTLNEAMAAVASGDAPAAPTPASRQARRVLRVLVADDHVVNQAVVSAMLRKWGHAVSAAMDGQDAIEKSGRESFDAILMDIQMPGVDGLQATRRIRERELTIGAPRLPIVAMTARAMAEDRQQCLDAGMDGFVSKPIDQQELFDVLDGIGQTLSERPEADAHPSLTPLISDPETSRHIAKLFLETAPAQMDRLRAAVTAHDGPLVGTTAHSLRGAMAHFRDANVSRLEQMEELARNGRLDELAALLPVVDVDVARLLTTLRAAVAT